MGFVHANSLNSTKTTTIPTSGSGNGNTQTRYLTSSSQTLTLHSSGTTQNSDPQGSGPSASIGIGSPTVSGSATQAPSLSSSDGTISPGTSSDSGLDTGSSKSVISTDSSTGTQSPSHAAALVAASHNHTGAITGGVVGGVIAFLLLFGSVILLRCRSKSSRDPAQLHANRGIEPCDVGYRSSTGITPSGKRPVKGNTTRGEKSLTSPVLPVSLENSQSSSSLPSNVQPLPAGAAVPVWQVCPK
jgi:hypothetical protein